MESYSKHDTNRGEFMEEESDCISLCQICRRSVEIVSHALIEYKAVGKIWKQSILADKGIEVYKGHDMLEVWFQMSKSLCKVDLELLGATWWITWNARNQLLFKGEKINSNVLAS